MTFATADTTVTVNAALPSAVAIVTGMQAQAQHPRPPRSLGTDVGPAVTDGLNRQVDGVVNALPPDLQGNIDALAHCD